MDFYFDFYFFLDFHFRGNDTLGLPSRGEVSCYIRLKCYAERNGSCSEPESHG